MSTPAAALTRATLSAGQNSTDYLRAGRGGTVLLLVSTGGESALSLQLMGVLSQRCRVIAPASLAAGPALAATLAEFLEGLGIETTAIVAEGGYCVGALEYAARAAGVSHLAMLVPGNEPVFEIHAAALEVLADSGADVMVRAVPADPRGIGALGEELLEFLE